MSKYLVPALGTAALLAAGSVAFAGPAQATQPDEELIDDALEAFEEAGAPAAIAEVRDGDEVYQSARGDRELGDSEAAEPDDHVRIASLTKSMVSTVALQLSDEDKLDLDDPVAKHLPDLLPYSETITVRQLLSHTSGVPDFVRKIMPSLEEGSLADVRTERLNEYSPDELVELATDEPLAFEPGSDFLYSNTNYVVAGALIEKLTGESVEDNLDDRIFEPLNLKRTYLPESEPLPADPHPHAYIATGEQQEPMLDTTDFAPSQLWTAGGVISNPSEVNSFYRALSDGTLLSSELLTEARDFTDASDGRYGMGLESTPPELPADCDPLPGNTAYGHTGGVLGYSSWSFHSPDGSRQATLHFTIDPGFAASPKVEKAIAQFAAVGLCDSEPDAAATGQSPSLDHATTTRQ